MSDPELIVRSQIRSGLINAGVAPVDADGVADLAIHAASEGIECFERKLSVLDGADWLNGMQIGLQLLAHLAIARTNGVMATAAKFGDSTASVISVDTRQ